MIGIVGNGFVGNAVYQNFRDKVTTKVYDVDKNMYASSTIHIKKFWILNNKYGLLIELKKLTIL